MGEGAPSSLLHLLLLFSSTILLVVAQTGFISIDCGAVEGWVSQTEIQWVPDGSYIDSGFNSDLGNSSISDLLRTLRYFPNGSISNCYVLPVSAGRQYFFRALFYYGNYDAKKSWPSFFLSFDGGNWTYEIVGTDYLLNDVASAEVIFTSKQGSVNLCLTSKDFVNNVPFISSLELRPLPTAFYGHNAAFKGSYLHVDRRRYFNDDETAVVRYPEDLYDRTWYPRSFHPAYANLISSNASFDTSNYINTPPVQVLMTALEGKKGSVFNYTLQFGKLDSDVLFYFYFRELSTNRTATDVREFNLVISFDNGKKSSPLLMTIGPNDSWAGYFWDSWGLSDNAVVAFSLTPTSNSTLPPILNAFEIFRYNEPLVTLPKPTPSPPSSPPSPSPPPPSPPPSDQNKKSSKTFPVGAIAGIAVGGGLIALICLLLIAYYCRRKNPPPDNNASIGLSLIGPIQYSYSDIQTMTGNFKDKIGDGGYADVYKGFTKTGNTQLAVKVIKATGNQSRDFNREISVLSVIHHFNLVDFVGYCAEGTKMILVYKFMQNSSLDRWIFNNSANPLSWERRFNIITGVASGLAYLHEQCGNIVLHLDLKPQNILLDEKFIPKVADFGISKLLNRDQSMIFTQTIRGSPLYIAPEMLMGAGLNEKMDVYSFGIIMLEIVAGRSILDLPGSTLAEVVSNIDKNEDFFPWELVDTAIRTSVDKIQAKRVIRIAFLCLLAPAERPAMSSVLHMLEGRIHVQALSAAQEANLNECFASKRSSLAFVGAPLMSYSNSYSGTYQAELPPSSIELGKGR